MATSRHASVDWLAPLVSEPKRRWIKRGAYVGVWTALGLLTATQFYLAYSQADKSLTWVKALLWQMPGWYLWGVWALIIVRLGRRFPLDKRRRLPNALAHVSVSVLMALAHLAFLLWLARILNTAGVRPIPFFKVYLGLLGSYFHYEVLVYWAILGVGYAVEYYKKYRERELVASRLERQLVQAQLEALKVQLQPHFLFNTLHAIAVLVRKHEEQAAIETLSRLSDLLRHVLEHGSKQEVSLRQELDFVERYLEIQQVRFRDRLNVRMQIAPDTLDAEIPSLILQPLVENAVGHGIAARADAGLIELSAKKQDGKLCIRIRDDGPGLKANKSSTASTGLGLANTRARLKHLCGNDYRFDLTNVEVADGGGAMATLIIPFHSTVAPSEGN